MKGHVSKDMTIGKGHPVWVYKQALILNCNHLIMSILYLIIHLLFTVLYGLLCYIPSILDYSCVSELGSSHLVSELRFSDPGLFPPSLSDLV